MTEVCLIDNTEHKSIISLCRYLKKLGIANKDYYDAYLKSDGDGICPSCGMETKFIKFSYYKFCCNKCASAYNNSGKYERTDETRRKISDSWSTRDSMWLEKRKETILERYGLTYIEFCSSQLIKRYDKISDDERIQFFDNIVSNQGFTKSIKYKSYMLGDKEVLVQGYEPYVLDILQEFYPPESIIVKRSKETMVRYIDENGKPRRYFPDIFLPDNVIIEVKSIYTLETNLENTLLKMKASYDMGYNPILVVWETKGERMEMCKKSLIETISSQAWNCTGRFNDYPFIGVGHKQTMLEVLGVQCSGS